MTDEQVHDIEVLNRLEKELQLKWGRGENIPADLLERISLYRNRVEQAIEPTNQ